MKRSLAVADSSEREEAILEVTRQNGTVLEVLDRLSLGVQYALDPLDDFIATGQEDVEQLDMCLKRHPVETQRAGSPSALRMIAAAAGNSFFALQQKTPSVTFSGVHPSVVFARTSAP